MTRTNLSISLAAVAALVLAAGCGGKMGAAKTIDNTESQNAGKTLAASVEDTANALGPADQGAAFASSNSCATLSGDVSDTDGDHIPANAVITFTDCTKNAPGVTYVLNGTETVKDDEPTTPAFAFTLGVDGTLVATAAQATATVHRTGSIVGSVPTPGTFQLAHNRHTDENAQAGAQTFTATEDYVLTAQYTPSIAWTPGQPAVAGTYSVDGTWNATVQNASADATVATTTPLSLDPACDTHVTAGTVTATFNGPHATRTLTVTWTACGTRTVTYSETPN